jgi:two-component system LytT family response regulator
MNHSLRVLIADDEELARRLIREYLRSHPDIIVISECETGTEAVDAIFAHQPDLIF